MRVRTSVTLSNAKKVIFVEKQSLFFEREFDLSGNLNRRFLNVFKGGG